MNGFQKSFAIIFFSIMIYAPVYGTEQVLHRNLFWDNSTVGAKNILADRFPDAKSLDEILSLIVAINPGPTLAAINVGGLPGNPVSSGDPLTDINTVTAAINPLSPNLGTAVFSVDALTGSPDLVPPVLHTNLFGDLTAVKTAIGPGASLGAAVSTDLALIDTPHLTPPVPTSNVLNTDIGVIRIKINPASLTLGTGVSTTLNLIGLLVSSGVIFTDLGTIRTSMGPYLSLQAGITGILAYIHTTAIPGGPASTNVVSTDLVTAKNSINNGALVPDLGSSIATVLQFIATGLLPGNPASTNIIFSDLALLLSKMNPISPNLGTSVTSLIALIGTTSLNPPVVSTGIISGDIQLLINAIKIGAPNLGSAVYQIVQKIFPAAPNLDGAVGSILTLIGTSSLVPSVPSQLIISADIQSIINAIFLGAPNLGNAFVQYRQSLCTTIGTADLNPSVPSTGVPTQDLLAIINAVNPGSLSVGAAVTHFQAQTGTYITKIGTANLNPPVPTSNNVLTDLGVVNSKINPGSPNIGGAIALDIGLIGTANLNPPVPTTGVLSTDLTNTIVKINPLSGNLGGAITAVLNFINTGGLFPAIISSGVISTDHTVIAGKIDPTANITLGAAITNDLNLIDTGGLNPPVASSTVIRTDLVAIAGKINPNVGITLGNAVTTEINFINTAGLPGNPGSTTVIHSDLVILLNLINAGSVTLGASVFTVSNLLGPANNFALFTKVTNLIARFNNMLTTGVVIPPNTGNGATLDQCLTNAGF